MPPPSVPDAPGSGDGPDATISADEVAAAGKLRDEMRVETTVIARDASVEDLIADFGIALWLNKPARRKAAA